MKLIKVLTIFVISMVLSNLHAQITIDNTTLSPEDLVNNVLLGNGITASNIEFNNSAAAALNPNVQAGSFTGGLTTLLNMDEGVILGSGNVQLASGDQATSPATDNVGINPDILLDPDLEAITGTDIENAAILEFDFVPSGTSISFDYIFASNEYNEYVNSINDGFAFLISGPGINGPFTGNAQNIAVVPGTTTPVSINTINNGPSGFLSCAPNGTCTNCQFFQDNCGGSLISYNGLTTTLTAQANVECGQTYHIKMIIGDAVDNILDSGVFLKGGSFSSNNIGLSIESASSSTDTLLIEDCTEGTITFSRFACDLSDTLVIFLETSGTSDEIDDYGQLAPGDSIFFLPGEDTVDFTISPIEDGITENPESVTVTAYFLNEFGDTISSEGTIWIIDKPPLSVETSDTTLYCKSDSLDVYVEIGDDVGVTPYTYEWFDNSTDSSTNVYVGELGEYFYEVVVTDACGTSVTDSARVSIEQTLEIDTMIQFPADCGIPNGAVSGQGSGFTGTPDYQWSGPGQPAPDSINASVWQNLPSGWYYFSIEDDVCFVEDSIFLEQDPPPTASFDANPTTGNAPLDVTFTNTSDPATTYDWDFGNGQTVSVNNQDSQNTTYTEEGTYTVTLTISDGNCTDQASQEIVVNLLQPLSYDLPNVFTPNNDGTNDFFNINAENAVSIDMVILNRWGNVVFETQTVGQTWNGTVDNNGTACNDGTYFYKFTIAGEDGEEIEEHGFVQLVRDTDK